MNNIPLTKEIAIKVRDTIRCGLTNGLGTNTPGSMCIEAAVCFAYGLPHGDNPPCVGSAVRSAKIRLNDSNWSSEQARANGMIKIGIAQLGSNSIDQVEFAKLLAFRTATQLLPTMFRKLNMEKEATSCESATTLAAAAYAAAAAANAANAAAANAAAAAATAANAAAAYAAAAAANAANAAAYAAAAAANAAYAAAAAANAAAARDQFLILFSDIILTILIEMKSPGCEFLYLLDPSTEVTIN